MEYKNTVASPKDFLVYSKEQLGTDSYYICKDNIFCGLGPLREDIFLHFGLQALPS